MSGIYITKDNNDFLKVCDKIEETRDCRIKEDRLYIYMTSGLFDDRTMTCVSYDGDKMNGCAILILSEDIVGDLTLFVLYMFIDRHYPDLCLEYIKFIENKARELRANKISFTTHRNPKAVVRKYGKYGYQHRCSIIEKRIEEEVN